MENITITEEERAIMFQSHELSKCKMAAIVAFGDNKPMICNKISSYIIDNFFEFIDPLTLKIVPRGIFITKIRNAFPKILSNTFDGETYKRIYTGYKNKVEAIKRKLVVKEKVIRDILYYKRKTVVKERDCNSNLVEVTKIPGDIREVRYKYIETPKTKALTYLAKYGNAGTYEFIKKQLLREDVSKSKKDMYESHIEMFEKYGFQTLLEEAISHRNKVFDKYLTPCLFESPTFFVDSRITETFIYNKKKGSKVKAFMKIALPYVDDKEIEHSNMLIPLKINDSYHGDIRRFNTSYTNNHIYLTITHSSYDNGLLSFQLCGGRT